MYEGCLSRRLCWSKHVESAWVPNQEDGRVAKMHHWLEGSPKMSGFQRLLSGSGKCTVSNFK